VLSDVNIDDMKLQSRSSTLISGVLAGLVPPWISRDLILTEMVSLIQIGIMKKVR